MNALDLLLSKGHAYRYNHCRHVNVVVYTKSITEIDRLKQAFGGRYYRHMSGYVWVLSRRKEVLALFAKIKDLPLDDHRFHHLMQLGRELTS